MTETEAFNRTLRAAVGALRRATEDLLEIFWDEYARRRVCEQATAMAQAAKMNGRIEAFTIARAVASICFLSREEALSIRVDVAEKLRELIGRLEDACRAVAKGETA